MVESVVAGEQALAKLMSGNRRFADGASRHPHQDPDRRRDLNSGQTPFAAVLTCADSRVPPELIFDQGLGDLFVVRVAGNIINEQLLGSLEYAAAHLHTPLIMVLSHSNCGAIGAVAGGADLEGHITSLAPAIQPAVDKARSMEGDLTDNAAREVARMTAALLTTSEPILAHLVQAGKLVVTAAFYNLDTGTVDLLEPQK